VYRTSYWDRPLCLSICELLESESKVISVVNLHALFNLEYAIEIDINCCNRYYAIFVLLAKIPK
jgi:hypothetical protein